MVLLQAAAQRSVKIVLSSAMGSVIPVMEEVLLLSWESVAVLDSVSIATGQGDATGVVVQVRLDDMNNKKQI